jgi:RNA polymerase sigma-70 factor (ECF subfamily)
MVREEHDIQALVRESASGDTQSFKKLYETLVDRVFAYVRYRTKNVDDAMDLTQDAMVALHKGLRTFTYRSREEFYAFVFTIVRRSLARYYEANTHSREAVDMDMAEIADTPDDGALRNDVERALDTLDESTREIVVLHHWSRYSFGEIAAIMDMQESAVRVRHHRALKTLKTHFDTP